MKTGIRASKLDPHKRKLFPSMVGTSCCPTGKMLIEAETVLFETKQNCEGAEHMSKFSVCACDEAINSFFQLANYLCCSAHSKSENNAH